MTTNKAASKSSAASDSYIGLVTQSHLKRSMQEQEQGFVLKKKSLEQLIESPKGGIIIRDNPLFNNSTPASNLSDKESHLEVVSVMMVDVAAEATMAKMERKINFLMKVVEERDHEIAALKDQMKACETAESSQTPVVKATDKGKNMVQENQPQQQSVSVASLSVQQLHDMIANSIKLTIRWKGHPKVAYRPFCRNMRKCKIKRRPTSQAVRSKLKRKCFRVGIKPRTFEELATRAHDMELSIANRGAKDFLVQTTRSDKNEINDTKKIANSILNESMVVQETPLKSFSKRKETKHERNHDGNEKRRPTLRERQRKVYLFPDSDVADMLEQLIEKQLIQLPKYKRPEQAGKVDDPNYCKYHRVISHPVEKCFVLKELILKLARENKIELDIDEVAQTNHVAVNMTLSVPPSILLYDQRKSLIQFGTFEPILVRFQQKIMTSNSQNKEEPIEDEGEEWIVVAHKKRETNKFHSNEVALPSKAFKRKHLP
ncbi:retrotransposon gag protein [Cucumis melo var. makuwa]|uniref:Retrotransposon gag protein n=1 Tax=Cucumis melo var. makuwa TaxID=1194695 RepID=A0A5A7SSD3_CUCMM|nr:retrotransposon gag protein [Cucumis melo var. makuwa]TYJ99906.1 retrotransposon gag protein [Cucumis melo var. makuwa]